MQCAVDAPACVLRRSLQYGWQQCCAASCVLAAINIGADIPAGNFSSGSIERHAWGSNCCTAAAGWYAVSCTKYQLIYYALSVDRPRYVPVPAAGAAAAAACVLCHHMYTTCFSNYSYMTCCDGSGKVMVGQWCSSCTASHCHS
jgi:hypothetical protein